MKGESYIVLFHISQFDSFLFACLYRNGADKSYHKIRLTSISMYSTLKAWIRWLKCQVIKDLSRIPQTCLGETKSVWVTLDTYQGHQGHQRPANDTKDALGIPHICLGCVSNVYSLWTVKAKIVQNWVLTEES